MAKAITKIIDANEKLLYLLVQDDVDTADQADDRSYILRNDEGKTFLQSKNVDIFPCARRGQYGIEDSVKHYDPEARLNTERTNRLHTAVNGFTDSFIKSFVKDKVKIIDKNTNTPTERDLTTSTLIFVLAGYHVIARNFDPAVIAEALSANTDDIIYAFLRLNSNVSLDMEGYFTEILYRQSTSDNNKNYLDVFYTYTDVVSNLSIKDDFFVGISFAKAAKTTLPIGIDDNDYYLPLFSYNDGWELVQTSLLPKIEHDTTEDSIKVSGNVTIKHKDSSKPAFVVTESDTTINVPTDITGDFTVEHNDGAVSVKVEASRIVANRPITTTTTDPITVTGDFEVKHDSQSSFKVTKDKVFLGPTYISDLTAGKLTVEAETQLGGTLVVNNQTRLNSGLSVTEGDTTLQKLSAGATELNSLAVHTDKFTVTATTANFKVPVTAESSVKTPTLDVKTIENKVDSSGVSIKDDLNIEGNLNVTTGYTIDSDTLNTNTINSRQENGTIAVESPITLNSTLGVTGEATLNNDLAVNGDTTLQKLTADSLEVTNKTTLKGEVQLDNKTTINNSLAITGTNNISTPTLKVNTITSDSAEVIVDQPLKVDSTLDVNSGKTTLHKGLTVKEGLTVESGAALLTSTLDVTDKATLNNGLEVTKGDAIIKSNLNVEDNINVGTPTTPAATNNGGCIVAQYNITAEEDLIAKQDISAGGSAAIAGNLTVGTDNNTDTGTIDAKKLVKVPTLDVQTIKNTKTDATTGATLGVSIEDALSITGATSVNNTITAEKLSIPSKIDENGEEKGEVVTPTLRVNRLTSDTGSITVDNKKLIVNKSLEMLAKADATGPALATVEKAVIGDLTVKVDAKLKDSTGKITALNSQITNNATIYDLDVGTNIDTTTLVATDTITAQEVVAEKVTQNGKAVPAIDLVQTGTVYQLQITLDASKK